MTATNPAELAPMRLRTIIKAAQREIATTNSTLSLLVDFTPPRRLYRQSATAPHTASMKKMVGNGLAGCSEGVTRASDIGHRPEKIFSIRRRHELITFTGIDHRHLRSNAHHSTRALLHSHSDFVTDKSRKTYPNA